MNYTVLNKDFFDRSILDVAPELLGMYLVRKIGSKMHAARITEVEAYDGPQDLACHASKGRTLRTETLYAEPGTIYVYLIYGMYYMLNIVTGKKDYPAAVLIRAIDDARGPGILTRKLHVDSRLNGKVIGKDAGLWIEDRGEGVDSTHIKTTPRIGVEYAGPVWSKKPYRFVEKGSEADVMRKPKPKRKAPRRLP